jgi:predicted lipoprotein with Yx(FWY)xxD motif
MKRILVPALGLAAATAIAAGCGSSNNDNSSNAGGAYGGGQTAKTAPAAASAAKVMTSKTSLGAVVVDGQGNTLYMFEKDKDGMSTCAGACASSWPPAPTSGKPVAAGKISAAKLGTTKRPDGTTQVTYGGWPLYRYAGDTKPGDTNGQNLDQFGAEWYVLGSSGKKIEAH